MKYEEPWTPLRNTHYQVFTKLSAKTSFFSASFIFYRQQSYMMCVCVCTSVCVCMLVYACVCSCVCICVFACERMNVYASASAYMHARICGSVLQYGTRHRTTQWRHFFVCLDNPSMCCNIFKATGNHFMQYWSPNFYSCALNSISHSISLLVGLYRLYIFAPAQSHMTDVVMYTLCELRGHPRGFPAPARPAPPIWPPGQRSMTIAATYTTLRCIIFQKVSLILTLDGVYVG